MGHYDAAYEAYDDRMREEERQRIRDALDEFMLFRNNYQGRKWTLQTVGLESDFNNMLMKLKARLFDLGDL